MQLFVEYQANYIIIAAVDEAADFHPNPSERIDEFLNSRKLVIKDPPSSCGGDLHQLSEQVSGEMSFQRPLWWWSRFVNNKYTT